MREIASYLKSVTINLWVLEMLKKKSYYNLGDFITFNLTDYPDNYISSSKHVTNWFKHILALMGFTYDYMMQNEYGKMPGCWIYPTEDHTTLRIVHRNFSYKQCLFIKTIVMNLCLFAEFVPIDFVSKKN